MFKDSRFGDISLRFVRAGGCDAFPCKPLVRVDIFEA
jgi:hypothetical protein